MTIIELFEKEIQINDNFNKNFYGPGIHKAIHPVNKQEYPMKKQSESYNKWLFLFCREFEVKE